MRPYSLVAPLLLIGVGVLFLLRNIYPDIPLLDYTAQYWPWLLVIWGGLRFLEVVFWWATDRPLPMQGINGGEWVLIVFLSLVGFSLHAARGFYNWLPNSPIRWGGLEVFGESFEYPLSANAATGAAPRIVIETFNGSARIVGGDVQEVTVTGRHTVRALNKTDADHASEESRLEVQGDNNQIVIRPQQYTYGERGAARVTSDLEITVPRGASIQARGATADFDVSSITGSVDIDAENSDVRLESVGGNVRVNTRDSDLIRAVNVTGSLDLQGRGQDIDLERIAGNVTVDGSYAGLIQFRELMNPIHWIGPQTEITAQGLPGDLRMTIGDINANNVRGPMRITTQSKDIWLTQVTEALDITASRGDFTLDMPNTPPPRMNVRLEAGNVELALPANAGFDLNATTNRGETINDYGDPIRQEFSGRGERGGSLRGTTGPGPAISISVGRGRLFLRRAGEILPRSSATVAK